MSKIRELTQEEAALLRQRVQQRFRQGENNGKGFRPSSFKGAYEDLRNDIIAEVPGTVLSVSLTRLRKLFYYTDPGVCPAEQLEKPSFGRDFIEALQAYVKEAAAPPEARRTTATKGTGRKLAWLLLLPILAGGILFSTLQPSNPANWREDFNTTHADSLRAHGFRWMDFDSALWSKQDRDGFLTLYTSSGDYWVKSGEARRINNLMYKKVSGTCFDVIAKIDAFNPQKNCQQLVLFLFDEHLSRETHLRAGISFWSPSEGEPGLQHVTANFQEKGEVTQLGYFHVRNPANGGTPIQSLWLKIRYDNHLLSVYQKLNNEWNLWGICARPVKLDLKPAYIGIAAFQGWTNDDGSPRNAAPIPALIDFILVESCDD